MDRRTALTLPLLFPFARHALAQPPRLPLRPRYARNRCEWAIVASAIGETHR